MSRGNHRWLGRLGILLGLVAVLLLAGVLFIASKLSGDEQVMNDIDRHFEVLDKTSSYASFYNAERRAVRTAPFPGDEPVAESSSPKKAAPPNPATKAGRRWTKRHRRGDKSPPEPRLSAGFEGIRNIAPGTYRIAGEECIAGVDYLRLEGRYRIERPVAGRIRLPSSAGNRKRPGPA